MKFMVTFTQEWHYEVEAEDEREAEDLAYKEFHKEMTIPIANLHYDRINIEDLEDPWIVRDL